MTSPLRVLLFSTLYPSAERPVHGIFVETRLRELLRSPGVQARVVAPVPWFPSRNPRFGDWAAMARTSVREQRRGLDVLHPRYPVLPKVGMHLAPLLLALGARRALEQVRSEGFDFDVIDAHYVYPDGVAAALLSRWLGRPFTVTARGSDVNLIAQYRGPRAMMRWALQRAAAGIGVSESLAQRLLDIGAPPERVHVARNGVDTELFRPEPQAEARARLGLGTGPVLLSVGNLLEVKRHHLVIEALARLRQTHPAAELAIVGAGPLRAALEAAAAAAGMAAAVRFAGAQSQDALRSWYCAADLLVLASSREGWPNVLLEAMACGTRVVASRVGGVPEIVCRPELGATVEIREAGDLATAVLGVLAQPSLRDDVRAHALRMGWEPTCLQLRAVLEAAAGRHDAGFSNEAVVR
jgi:glycosyltransferase involved in cell wall biosynthesis